MKAFKGLLIILMSLALVGCSGGPYASVDDDQNMGMLLLSIAHTGSLQDEIGPQLVPVEATHARVRLIGGGFDRNITEDIAIHPGETNVLELRVPVGTYEVHVIAYNQYSDSEGNKYGTALTGNTEKGILVSEGSSTVVNMTLEKFGFTVSGPTELIREGSQYYISFQTTGTNGIDFLPQRKSSPNYQLMSSRQAWAGDTELNLPSDIVIRDTPYDSDNYYHQFAPKEYGATVYYQIRTQLSNSYNYSSGKDFCPLYFYFPSTTYGEELGMVRTTPLGDVIIGID